MGASWTALEPLLGLSWALLGVSWLPQAAQEGPGLDFRGFWECPGKGWEVPRLYFSKFFHTFRSTLCLLLMFCAMPFSLEPSSSTLSSNGSLGRVFSSWYRIHGFNNVISTLLHFPAFSSYFLVRRSVRSTSAASRRAGLRVRRAPYLLICIHQPLHTSKLTLEIDISEIGS